MRTIKVTSLTKEELLRRIEQQENVLNLMNIRCCSLEYENRRLRNLLYEMKFHKLKHFKERRSVGEKAIRYILDTLQKAGVSDKYNRCHLFLYI